MRWLDIFRLRLRSIFNRGSVEHDLDEELRYHLERQIEEEIAAGKAPEEARFSAMRSIAALEQRKEECRDARSVNLLSHFEQDIRYALRQLARNPGFAFTAVAVLALGMCASVAIFAFVNAALIKPLPYRDPGRLAGVFESTPQCPHCNLSWFDFIDWKQQNKVFRSLDVYRDTGFIMATPEGARPATGARVSAGFFRTLGVKPAMGRDFNSGEDRLGAPRTAMLSYKAWKQRFGADRNVVGKVVTLDGAGYVIIGVLPRDFEFAPADSAEIWATIDPSQSCEKRRSCHGLYGVGRLKDGVSIESALADTKIVAARLEKLYPDSNRGQGASVVPLTEVIVGEIRPILMVLLSGAALLLVIAYVNTSSLLLVRSESRKHEIAVRTALGAGNGRLMLQFVTEGLVLVIASSAAGLLATRWAVQLLTKLIPSNLLARMPFLQGVGLNPHVLLFAAAVGIMALIVFALTPVIHFAGSSAHHLQESSRSVSSLAWRRVGSKLVVVELAIAVVLCAGAGLLGKSLHNLLTVTLNFDPDHLATVHVVAPPDRYANKEQQVALMRLVISRVSAMPGVQSVASTSLLPVTMNGNTNWIRFVGRPYDGKHNEVNAREVSSEFFKTLHAQLLRGRLFTDAEDLSKPRVVIINQALARAYFTGEDPIGKQIGNTALAPDSIRTIIGVVADIREASLDAEIAPAEYEPANQNPDSEFALLVRTSQSAESMLPAITGLLHKIDPGMVTLDEVTMSQRIENSPSAYSHRSAAWLVSSFAGLALLFAVLGLYGVVAYSVRQRTREIGVRMALGADPASVYGLIFREVVWLVLAGTAAGIATALAGFRYMHDMLFGVQSWDLSTMGAVTAILISTTLLASYLPARRAASVNPTEALRVE
ncbi:MAG: ABC transporter permease [Acidobacteriaceae bacterium]|nr:ABC transporter permease [Acidobacteriaceae bacterium]